MLFPFYQNTHPEIWQAVSQGWVQENAQAEEAALWNIQKQVHYFFEYNVRATRMAKEYEQKIIVAYSKNNHTHF